VIDDPQLYLVNASRVTAIVERKKERARAQATARKEKEEKTDR
jgi:hypothetical protein